MAELYPTRTWGAPDDAVRFGAGIGEDDGAALAEELAQELDAATLYRPGEDHEYCNYIYVLCMGREPCAVQMRDGQVAVPDEIRSGERVSELYLRVALSTMARFAGVQEVRFDLWRDESSVIVRETPRPGVYDAPLLRRMQRLVALLPAYDITNVDFGEISAPPEGFDPADYATRYGGVPDLANYLFYPQPTTEVVTQLVQLAGP